MYVDLCRKRGGAVGGRWVANKGLNICCRRRGKVQSHGTTLGVCTQGALRTGRETEGSVQRKQKRWQSSVPMT